MIFSRIIELYKVARIELSLANLQLYARTRFSNSWKFLKSINRKCVSFSLLRYLIIRLHLKLLPKLRKTIKTSHFVDVRQALNSNGY